MQNGTSRQRILRQIAGCVARSIDPDGYPANEIVEASPFVNRLAALFTIKFAGQRLDASLLGCSIDKIAIFADEMEGRFHIAQFTDVAAKGQRRPPGDPRTCPPPDARTRWSAYRFRFGGWSFRRLERRSPLVKPTGSEEWLKSIAAGQRR
jgi:hypothetical protein